MPKMSLPKRSVSYWSKPVLKIFLTFRHSGAQDSEFFTLYNIVKMPVSGSVELFGVVQHTCALVMCGVRSREADREGQELQSCVRCKCNAKPSSHEVRFFRVRVNNEIDNIA